MEISNEVYEQALNNKENLDIMNIACAYFTNILDQDDIYSCKLIALWKTLRTWRPDGGAKFTSFLFKRVKWECLKHIRYNNLAKIDVLENVDNEVKPEVPYDELVEHLPTELQDIVIKRYIYGMTLTEIGESCGCCYETVRKRLKKVQEYAKKHDI